MKYSFYLRNTETNDSCLYADAHDYESEHEMLFQWLEGNFSCDCNRSMFLYSHQNNFPCNSDDNIIVIDKIIAENEIEIKYNPDDYG